MKKIIILLSLISVCFLSEGQIRVKNYTWNTWMGHSRFDSTVRMPLDTFSFAEPGSIVFKSNHFLGKDTNNVWNRLALYADIAAAGTNIYNSNGILNSDRTLTGRDNTYSLHLDSLKDFRVGRNGIDRFYFNSTTSFMTSQNQNATVTVNPSNAFMNYQANAFRVFSDSMTATKWISYETNINGSLTPNALTTKSYVDSVVTAGGGGTPRFAVEDNIATGSREFDLDNNTFNIFQYNNGNTRFSINPITGTYLFGDADDTYTQFDTANHVVVVQADNLNKITYDGPNKTYTILLGDNLDRLFLDAQNGDYIIGDRYSGGDGNNTYLDIDDANQKFVFNKRVLKKQGTDVTSLSGAIALNSDGNSFEITGTNTVTLISNVNWQNGSEVTLWFTSTASLTDGTANSGTDIGMELNANTNFTGSAGASITLQLIEIGGTQRWREKCRSVN